MRKFSIRFVTAGAALCLMPAIAWAQASRQVPVNTLAGGRI